MKRLVQFGLGFILLAAGCGGDTVRSHYATRQMAEGDRLFERGWLPEMIPSSSFDIVTRNDLDLNTSEGEFSFAPADAADFRVKLRRMEVREIPESAQFRYLERGYWPYEYNKGERWIFYIHESRGHCEYEYGMNVPSPAH